MRTDKKAPSISTRDGRDFVLNARPDTIDFRDRMYVPTLVSVPATRALDQYRVAGVALRDQGAEGACTGFALAAVADYLLHTRDTRDTPDTQSGQADASAHMLYAMARRYDEWPGEDYSGSSARGAMKGWFQHGVCSEAAWPSAAGVLDAKRSTDALARPLGAYFRVDHSDLIAMHAALAEVGILYATAQVHAGWKAVPASGLVPFQPGVIGGHAFAIVGFDRDGFWFQNSWGADWGKDGFGRISYVDWLSNGTDVWVARLGVPLSLEATVGATSSAASSMVRATPELDSHELRPHIVSLGNDGRLDPTGHFGNSQADVAQILGEEFPRITKGWKKRRLMLFAHGGLNDENSAVERTKLYRDKFLPNEIYPLSIIWHSDILSTVGAILADGLGPRRPEGFLGGAKDFLLDRLDDTLEPVARNMGGKAVWDEMKENALAASSAREGGLRQLIPLLPANAELHLVGHSAGAIVHTPLARALAAAERQVESCTLWAPACTMEQFGATWLQLLHAGAIRRFCLYTLTEKAEQDDNCMAIYNKSLLYLVSNALEATPHIPLLSEGEPLLGMARYVAQLDGVFGPGGVAEWVQAPNNHGGKKDGSQAKHHGDFDDDPDTLESTIARILNRRTAAPAELSAPLPTRCKVERRQRLAGRMHWARPQ